jgi:cytochrome c biogenesis protein CcmG/thiol:disulfide interchange protein DsbE
MKSPEKKFLLLFLVVAGLIFWQYYVARFRHDVPELVGKPAPAFEAETLDGAKFVLKDHVGKKVLLVNFWATWCEPCREEMPVLISLNKALDPSRFLVVPLLEDDAPTTDEIKRQLAAFTKKIPLPFPVYSDRDGLIADLYGTYKIPESYLIDLDGNVAHRYVGAISDWERETLIKTVNEVAGTIPTTKPAEPISP